MKSYENETQINIPSVMTGFIMLTVTLMIRVMINKVKHNNYYNKCHSISEIRIKQRL